MVVVVGDFEVGSLGTLVVVVIRQIDLVRGLPMHLDTTTVVTVVAVTVVVVTVVVVAAVRLSRTTLLLVS